MEPYIELFIGQPVGDPLLLAEKFFSDAEITKMTSEKIVIKDDAGGKVVFFGDFVIDDEDVTGTMTGFKFKDEDVKLIEGGGYDVDIADLIAASSGGGSLKVDAIALEEESIFSILTPDGILIEGSDLGDRIVGIDADDAMVKGREGDDLLVGGDGNQVLKGGKGNDLIGGGQEKDKLYGGNGKDTFFFDFSGAGNEAVELPVTHRIKDFDSEDDTIALSFKGLEPGFLDSDLFKKGPEATSEDHRIIYDKDTGKLYFDDDGSGDFDQIHFGSVKAGTTVKASDFIVTGFLIES